MINMKNQTVILLLGIFPGLVHALGLGDIQTDSYLGQPFKARIEIVSASVPELDSLTVILGDDAAFERSGLDRRHELNQMQFKLWKQTPGNTTSRSA
jgi:Tfp pilus assembly protein FimV